jgi:hypothetical protein
VRIESPWTWKDLEMTNEQKIAMDDITATISNRLALVRELPTTGWVLGLRKTPAFYLDGSPTLSGLEHATRFDEPRGAWNIRNRAGEALVWMTMRQAVDMQIQSLEQALGTLGEMLGFVPVPPVAA